MLQMLKARRDKAESGDKGFTLIELMVVVLIIAILLAIAIPTFLGARGKSQAKAAQSSVRNGLTAAKALMADRGSFTGIDAAALSAEEPSLTFVDAGTDSSGFKTLSVNAASAETFYAAVWGENNTCYYIRESNSTAAPGAGTRYAKGTTAADCDATFAAGIAAASWNADSKAGW